MVLFFTPVEWPPSEGQTLNRHFDKNTQTISIELDVYEKLAAAKTGPRDFFSKVIRRTHFESPTPIGSELLEKLDALFSHLPDDGISREDGREQGHPLFCVDEDTPCVFN